MPWGAHDGGTAGGTKRDADRSPVADGPPTMTVLPGLIEAQTARTPRSTAVVNDGERLSYADLNGAANRLARLLLTLGVVAESRVVLLMPHRPLTVVAMLAVLKAGGSYVPVETSQPEDRVNLIVTEAAPAVVLTAGPRPAVSGAGARVVDLEATAVADRLRGLPDGNLTDEERGGPIEPRSAAYVIFTSGSTGRPKGVVVEHHALSSYLAHTAAAYPATAGKSLVVTSLAVDLTVTGLFTPLVRGGTVQLLELTGYQDGDLVLLDEVPATFMKVTPSHLRMLGRMPSQLSPSRQLLTGGEPLLGQLLRAVRETRPEVSVHNVYGPTEAVVNCAEYLVPPDAAPGPVPFGSAQPGHHLAVLDETLTAADEGELWIGGTGLARGYLNRPDLTADRFCPDPDGAPGSRRYRTGDRVRQDVAGLQFVGRMDDQVKVHGHRVELGEIEAALQRCTGVGSAACVAQTDAAGDTVIVAVLSDPDGAVDHDLVQAELAARLPDYLRPARLATVDALPLNRTGKVDRRRLAAQLDLPNVARVRYRELRSGRRARLVWVVSGDEPALPTLVAATPDELAVGVLETDGPGAGMGWDELAAEAAALLAGPPPLGLAGLDAGAALARRLAPLLDPHPVSLVLLARGGAVTRAEPASGTTRSADRRAVLRRRIAASRQSAGRGADLHRGRSVSAVLDGVAARTADRSPAPPYPGPVVVAGAEDAVPADWTEGVEHCVRRPLGDENASPPGPTPVEALLATIEVDLRDLAGPPA